MKVGDTVRAVSMIVEGLSVGKREVLFPENGYIHAEPGDRGVVEGFDDNEPTVRFDRTGTASICGLHELEAALSDDAEAAVKRMLNYALRDIHYSYDELTAEEKSVVTEKEFSEIVNWIK